MMASYNSKSLLDDFSSAINAFAPNFKRNPGRGCFKLTSKGMIDKKNRWPEYLK